MSPATNDTLKLYSPIFSHKDYIVVGEHGDEVEWTVCQTIDEAVEQMVEWGSTIYKYDPDSKTFTEITDWE